MDDDGFDEQDDDFFLDEDDALDYILFRKLEKDVNRDRGVKSGCLGVLLFCLFPAGFLPILLN